MKINYLEGDATKPGGDSVKLIIHVVNNMNSWGSGFVLALNKAFGDVKEGYMSPEKAYHNWFELATSVKSLAGGMGDCSLGNNQLVMVAKDIGVVNMMAQDNENILPEVPLVDYKALHKCLCGVLEIAKRYENMGKKCSIHGPRFGSGIAGGSWTTIEALINHVFGNYKFKVNIYDYKDTKSISYVLPKDGQTNILWKGKIGPAYLDNSRRLPDFQV